MISLSICAILALTELGIASQIIFEAITVALGTTILLTIAFNSAIDSLLRHLWIR